jgi:ADP-ribosylglycohydrolase
MLGSIIGDIVGSRFEFHNHRSTNFPLFDANCDFTDDTVCTIAVMDWLVGGAAENTFAATLQRWCARYLERGYGGMFLRWIDNPVRPAERLDSRTIGVAPQKIFSQLCLPTIALSLRKKNAHAHRLYSKNL